MLHLYMLDCKPIHVAYMQNMLYDTNNANRTSCKNLLVRQRKCKISIHLSTFHEL